MRHNKESIDYVLGRALTNGSHPLGSARSNSGYSMHPVRVVYKDRKYSVLRYKVEIVDGFSTIEDTSLVYEGTKSKVTAYLLSGDLDLFREQEHL